MGTKNISRFIQKVYRNISRNRLGSLILFSGLATAIGLLFQPHLKSLAFGSMQQEKIFESFVAQTQQGSGIDTREFWEFRELYAPGSFTFDAGVEHLGTQVIQRLPEEGQPLHIFRSQGLLSHDYLVTLDPAMNRAEQAQKFLSEQTAFSASEILYEDEDDQIFVSEDGTRVVFFYRPIEELYTVDGLFDFTDAERALLENTFWISTTILTK